MWPDNTPYTKHGVPGHNDLYFYTDNVGQIVRRGDGPPRWAPRDRMGRIVKPDAPLIVLDNPNEWYQDTTQFALETLSAALKGWSGASIASGVIGIAEGLSAAAASAAATTTAEVAAEEIALNVIEQSVGEAFEIVAEESMFDWLSSSFDSALDFVGDMFSTGDAAEFVDEAYGGFGDLGEFGMEQVADVAEFGLSNALELGGDVLSTVGQVQNIFGSGGPDRVITTAPTRPQQQFFPQTFGGTTMDEDQGGGGMVQTGGPLAAGAIWLGSYLARAIGRSGAVFQAANGIRVRLTQLWPLVRKYGPGAVAGGLGISIGSLGTLLMQAPTSGHRRRSRGISARDVKTTRRTLRSIKKLYRMMPTRPSSGRGYGGGGYRPRRRRYAY